MSKRARQCGEPTKRGTPCKNPPVRGFTTCIGHLSRKDKEALGFGGPQPGSGKPRKPRVTDLMRQRVEEEADRILAPYFEAIEGAVVHATFEGVVHPSDHPDLAARIAAAEKLLDRVYGRPRQEITGADGAPLQLEVTGAGIVNDPAARKHAEQLRRRVGAAREKQPGRSRASH